MILSLVDVRAKYRSLDSTKSYWNTYHCQNRVFTANGRLYGKYCKNRFCTLCCSIRKAFIINSYLPVIKTWEEPHFVTLTIRSVPMSRLGPVMKSMLKGFKKITAKYRKREQRGKSSKLIGIRALECNFNVTKRTYNPHFHLITPNREIAEILIKEWLSISKPGWSIRKAQFCERVYSNEKALIEIVKYGSKIFSEPDIKKKSKSNKDRTIYAAALDNIFNAMQGLRIFERFGFNLPEQKTETTGLTVIKEYKEWVFDIRQFDWKNEEGERLSEYSPKPELVDLLSNCIDINLR